MALRRVLAVLAAIAMIGGALQVRALREGGTLVGEDPGSRDGPAAPLTDGDDLTLTCADVLVVACRNLATALGEEGVEVTVASPTAAAGGQEAAAGVVLTLAPLQDLLVGSGAATPDVTAARVLARSPLVVAIWSDRAAILDSRCGGALTWRCLGDATGGPGTWAAAGGSASWGPVKPGHGDPTTSEAGALVLGQLAASYFGRAEISNRNLDDIGFFSWFTGLEQAVPTFAPPSGSPFLAMVQFGPAAFDAVGVVEADAVGLLARSSERAATLTLRSVEPLATADVVVVPVGSDPSVGALLDEVVARGPGVLAQAGWRVEGRAPEGALAQVGVQDLGSMPASTGLPSAGTLEALRRTWSEVTR